MYTYKLKCFCDLLYSCAFSQGDGNIRYCEVSESEPYFNFLNEYRSSSPQRGLGVMPKRGLDITSCEIYRFYKLHNNNFVEPIAMTVPRRVSTKQMYRELQNQLCTVEPRYNKPLYTM